MVQKKGIIPVNKTSGHSKGGRAVQQKARRNMKFRVSYLVMVGSLIPLGSLVTQPIVAKSTVNQRAKIGKHTSKRQKCCKEVNIITARDINNASRTSNQGLVLDIPGNYLVCENVEWEAATSNSFAITVSGKNISLDLDGHFIKQTDTSLAGNFAIQIDRGASNTLVHNGIVQQFSGGGLIVQPGVSCVNIDRIDFNQCCYNGLTTFATPALTGLNAWAAALFVNGSATQGVDNITVTNCNFCDIGILGAFPVWFTGAITGSTLTLDAPPLSPLNTGFILTGQVIAIGTITNNTLILSEVPAAGQEISVGNVVSAPGVPAGTTITGITADPRVFAITPSPDVNQVSITIFNYAGTVTGTTADPKVYSVSPTANVGPEPMVAIDPQGLFIRNSPTALASISSILTNYASHVTVRNCIINGNFGYGFSFALFFANSFSVVASKLVVNDLVTFGLAKGVSVLQSRDISIEDAFISDIVMNVTPDANAFQFGHGAEGIKVSSSSDWILRRVAFSGNRIQTEVPTALTTSGLIPYLDCTGLIVDAPGTTTGSNGLIEDCSAQNMQNDGGEVASNVSYSVGFNMTSEFGPVNTIRYSGCSASDIEGSVGWAYGFGCTPVPGIQTIEDDIIYKDCTAEDIRITGDGKYAAGFVLTSSRNQVVECTANRIIDERSDPAAYGIILDDLTTGQADSSIIADNLLTNCSTYALFDNTTLKNSVITGNNAVRCGPDGQGPNYFGLNPAIYTSAIQQNWLLSGPPPAVPISGSALANVDAHN